MVAFRVALGLLFTLLAAAPALAQDLTGTWRFRSVSGIGERGTICASGSVTFNSSGAVTAGTLQECDSNVPPTPLVGGRLTVGANGNLSGTIDTLGIEGNFLPAGDAFVAVNDVNEASVGFGFAVFVKDTATTYAQSNVTGTWRAHLIEGGELPTTITAQAFGSVDVGPTGNLTGGFLTFFSAAEGFSFRDIVGGNVSIDSEGVMTGTVLTLDEGTNASTTTVFNGLMATDKKLATGTLRVTNGEDTESGLVLLQREPPPTYVFNDIVGRWTLNHLVLDAARSDEATWFRGALDIDATGTVTGTLTDPEGTVLSVTGDATLDTSGFVNAALIGGSLSFSILGTMFDTKTHVIGSDTIFQTPGPGTPGGLFGVGLLSMRKAGPAAPPTSTVQFRTSTFSVTEGGVATILVDRTGSSTGAVTVDYQADPGTATAGDFTPRTGTLTFLSGQMTQTFTVTTAQDPTVEGNETVLLTLLNPAGGAALGARSTATLTIVDDETFVQFLQPTYTVKENVATAVITVVRSGALTNPFTVPYTATPLTAVANRDFKPVAGTLTFAAGAPSRTFSVPIVNGTLVDGNRSVGLALGPPVGNAQLGELAAATLIIQDDDLPGVFKVDKGTYTVLESAPSLAIIVRRTGTSLAGNVSVNYATVDGTASSEGTPRDYTATSGTLTFAANETARTVTIPLLKDNLVDGDKTFSFVLSEPSSGATLGAPSTAVVTIKDVDLGGVLKFASAAYSVGEGAGQVTLTVLRSGGAAGGVLVGFRTVDGSAVGGVEDDFVTTSGTLTFGPGNTSATITIRINQDTLAEGNETFQVQLTSVAGGATLGTPNVATVTIVDDESAFQFDTAAFTVTEGTASAVIKVTRTGTLTAPATVGYSAAAGTAVAGRDFTPVAGVLSFPANTPSKTFNVPILNNTLLDGNRSVLLALDHPTGGAQLGTSSTATLTILDNEQAGIFKLDKAVYSVAESAGFLSLNVLRTGANLAANVSVTLIATDGTAKNGVNYTTPTGPVTFTAGQTTQLVKVPILRDFVVTGSQTFALALANATSGATLGAPATATVTITEADLGGQFKFASAAYTVAETAGSVSVVVQRTGGTAGGALVDFITVPKTAGSGTEGGDFTPVSGTLTFGAGNTSATIVVPITQDDVVEPNEAFQVVLANARGGATLGAPSITTVTIVEMQSMVQFSGKFLGNFPEIVRTGSLATEITVDFVATDGTAQAGSDYLPASGTLTFKANVAVQYIPLTIIGDNLAEGSETFSIALRNPRAPARLGPNSVREFAIADNDFGGNVGFEGTLVSVTEGNTVDVGITRTGGLGTVLVVQWQAGAGSATPGVDFTPASGSVTFGANDSRKTFPITALTDARIEDPETVTLTLSVPPGAATLARATITLRILDAPPVLPVVQFGAPANTTVRGQDALIAITRSGPGTALGVDWMATGGTAVPGQHFDLPSGSVSFAPADITRAFEVTVLGSNSGVEPDRTVLYGLSVEPGTATIGATNSSTLTIFGSPVQVNFESPVYSVTEGGGPARIAVTRSLNLNRQVSVSYATSNGTAVAGTHYTAQSGTLTFAIGQESASFAVPILSNGPGDGNRTVNLTLSNPSPNTFIGEGQTATLQIREGPAYTFQLIADTTGEFLSFGGVPAINENGAVAFKAFLSDERQRILRGNGSAPTTIATTSSAALIDFGQRMPIDSAGRVTFLGSPTAGGQGVFRGSGGALETLITTGAPFSELFDPSVSPNGNVALAVRRASGDLTLFRGPAAGPLDEIPNLADEFSNLNTRPAVNDDGLVAFVATGESRSVFTVDTSDVFTELASDVTTRATDNVSINALGQVAVITGLPAPDSLGIIVGQGGSAPTPFVTLANGFQTFGDGDNDDTPVINARGEVGYLGLTTETFGILTGPDPIANLVIRQGDPLFGSTVQSLRFGGINGAGKIVFLAGLSDGRQVVVVASPPAVQTDLAVTKTVSTASPTLGSTVTFTITARNNGPASAPSVVVTDLLPSGYTFVSATPSRGTYTPNTGVWAIGTLAGSGSNTATLTLVATVLPTGAYNNTATITAAGVIDSNAGNNTATVVVTPVLQADVAITKTASNASPLVGTSVTFTVTATNLGPAAVTALTVTDLLPTGYTFVSSTPSQGTYASGSGLWTVGGLAAGGNVSATLQITATVKASGVYNNTATRTTSTPNDPNAANDAKTVTVTPVSALVLTTDGPLVGVGRTIGGKVTLPSAAPAGGVSVTLGTNQSGVATVTPGTLTINAGQTIGAFTVTGVAPGDATITGTATGFASGGVNVTVTSSVISLGTLPTLGPGQPLSLPISLSTPAPAGGVTVSFASTNTNIVTVTPSVFIPQGTQVPSANPQVTGVNIGAAQINASAIGFAPDTRSANVSVTVTFTTPFSVVTNTTKNITVTISAPAPSSGLTFNLATANASVATVVSPVTVAAGQTSAQAAVTGHAVASTTLQASGSGVTSTPVTITVTQPPVINLAPQTIGKDLQVQGQVVLGAAAPAGGTTVTLTSGDQNKVRLSTSGTANGSAQITVQVAAGSTVSPVIFIQALDSTGSVIVTMTATAFQTSASTMTLAPSGFILNSPGNFTTTTLSAPTSIQVLPSRLNPTGLTFSTNQALRGGLVVNVPVTATDQPGSTGVGTISTSPVVFGGGNSSGTTTFVPGAPGTSLLTVGTPTGFSTPGSNRTLTATVTAPAITLSGQTIGKNLEVSVGLVLGAPAPTGGLAVTLTSGDASKLLLANTGTVAGNASITVTLGQGASFSQAFFVQALDSTGSVVVTMTAPGFQTSTSTMTLTPSGFIINSPGNFATTTLSNPTSIQLLPARLTPGTLSFSTNQTLRGGIVVNVPVTATDQPGSTGVGTISTSPVVFNGGDTFATTTFVPGAAGSSLIEAVAPAGFSTPATLRTITATVSAPVITLAAQTIGKDLEVGVGLSLGAPAPAGGLPITVTSGDPTKLLVAASGTVAGNVSGSLTFTVAQNVTSTQAVFLQALDSTGTVTVTVSAPGYQASTSTMTLVPSGFAISNVGNFTTTTFSPATTIQVLPYRLTPGTLAIFVNQTLRGGLTVNVPVTATDQTGGPGVGVITGSPLVFNGGDTFKQAGFDPAVAGTTLVAVVPPTGFSAPSSNRTLIATVTAPPITFGVTNVQVGRDLQQSVSVFLGATPPSPMTVTVKVASTAIATITTDGTVAGSSTVTFTNVTSTFAGTLIVQGRAAAGTTTLSAQAAGFADGASTVTAQPSGFVINSPGSFSTTAGAANTNIQIVSMRLNPTTLNTEVSQVVRGGVTVSVPVTATTLTGSGVGTITTSPVSFTANTNAVVTQFDPAAVGTAAITVGLPTGFDRPSDRQQITVTVNP